MLKKAGSPSDSCGIRKKQDDQDTGGDINRLYLDIGGKSVRCSRLIGIFDMDNATTEKATVEFLGQSEKDGRLENLCGDIPVSFIVCDGTIYLSPLSGRNLARTVNKR